MIFQTRVCGKWILAGEHAVLRGAPALVFPLPSRYLDFYFSQDHDLGHSCWLSERGKKFFPSYADLSLKLDLSGPNGEELELLFWGVLEKACALKKVLRSKLQGNIKLYSCIPVGAGLGASAVLCVTIAKWFQHLKILSQSELFEFSRLLENLFHGESSGVDLAVAISGAPVRYLREGGGKPLTLLPEPQWKPALYISYSGKRGATIECVNQVKKLINQNPQEGLIIDGDMRESVRLAEEALKMEEEQGFLQMKKSMELGKSCFERWGLTEGLLNQHMEWLLSHGASAVKPTGSGNGGYVLSLWPREASAMVQTELLPCFEKRS